MADRDPPHSRAEGSGGPIGRRRALAMGAGSAAASALAAGTARAEEPVRWRMVTSWPRGAPGPGTSADRIARQITALSAGRLAVEVYGAGELVPAFEVFDAVSLGTAEMGHSAAFFWAGKMPAAPFFTAVPFGLLPEAHHAWILSGGGQALWDELYGPHQVKPFLAGNSGMQMGGWFNRRIDGLDDLRGLRIRMPGLGGEVLRRLGATPVNLPPGEIFQALQTGVVDGAEFLGPWSDLALGLDQAAGFYYWPGFHEPNGSAECLVNRAALDSLPEDLRDLVAMACQAETALGLAEANWQNAAALETLQGDETVTLLPFPDPVLQAAREAADMVLQDLARDDPLAGRIYASFREARARLTDWAHVTAVPILGSRSV